jgi:hypothetical protein
MSKPLLSHDQQRPPMKGWRVFQNGNEQGLPRNRRRAGFAGCSKPLLRAARSPRRASKRLVAELRSEGWLLSLVCLTRRRCLPLAGLAVQKIDGSCGRAIISQKMPRTAMNAGKPKASHHQNRR